MSIRTRGNIIIGSQLYVLPWLLVVPASGDRSQPLGF
jgi:hypothetical protein